jgi:hypothetical protein
MVPRSDTPEFRSTFGPKNSPAGAPQPFGPSAGRSGHDTPPLFCPIEVLCSFRGRGPIEERTTAIKRTTDLPCAIPRLWTGPHGPSEPWAQWTPAPKHLTSSVRQVESSPTPRTTGCSGPWHPDSADLRNRGAKARPPHWTVGTRNLGSNALRPRGSKAHLSVDSDALRRFRSSEPRPVWSLEPRIHGSGGPRRLAAAAHQHRRLEVLGFVGPIDSERPGSDILRSDHPEAPANYRASALKARDAPGR